MSSTLSGQCAAMLAGSDDGLAARTILRKVEAPLREIIAERDHRISVLELALRDCLSAFTDANQSVTAERVEAWREALGD